MEVHLKFVVMGEQRTHTHVQDFTPPHSTAEQRHCAIAPFVFSLQSLSCLLSAPRCGLQAFAAVHCCCERNLLPELRPLPHILLSEEHETQHGPKHQLQPTKDEIRAS